jgi:hypothetical protein
MISTQKFVEATKRSGIQTVWHYFFIVSNRCYIETAKATLLLQCCVALFNGQYHAINFTLHAICKNYLNDYTASLSMHEFIWQLAWMHAPTNLEDGTLAVKVFLWQFNDTDILKKRGWRKGMFFSLHSRVSIISLFEGTYLLFFMVLEGIFFCLGQCGSTGPANTRKLTPRGLAGPSPASHAPCTRSFSPRPMDAHGWNFFSTIIFPSRSYVQVKFSVHI